MSRLRNAVRHNRPEPCSRWAGRAGAVALIASLASGAVPPTAWAADAATPGVEMAPYSTSETDIQVLLADPQSRAVLEKYVPAIAKSGQAGAIPNTTLKGIQGYALPILSDKVLAQIDAELSKLPPKPVTPRRQTTNEGKVRPYQLPDPLIAADGRAVRDPKTWRNERRPEIRQMFETLEYGRAPPRPTAQRFEVLEAATPAFEGRALRKQVKIHVAKDPAAPTIHLVEYIPSAAKRPVPMLLVIGFSAPSAMFNDPTLPKGMVWDPVKKQKVQATSSPTGRLDVQKFLDAGYGVAGFYYGDLDPDFPGGYPLGVRAVYDHVPEAQRAPDAWGAIAAWAWSLSRVQDYLETDKDIDARRVAIYGASRLGKTVLWAAARDERFAAVIACCSGKMGAGLMKRNFGESIGGDDRGGADHWVAPNFRQFYGHEEKLPMDGHMLLALIAPRPVLLQTGRYDHAADPKGEFLAGVAASPVYELLGKKGLTGASWPPAEPILNDIGYWMNDGGHGVAKGDWDVYLAFLDKHLKRER